jgi:histidine triad (HIT) family protein
MDDGMHLTWPRKEPGMAVLQAYADKLRTALAAQKAG